MTVYYYVIRHLYRIGVQLGPDFYDCSAWKNDLYGILRLGRSEEHLHRMKSAFEAQENVSSVILYNFQLGSQVYSD
jgi:hypothetical protein